MVIDAMALVIVALGTVVAFVSAVRLLFSRDAVRAHERRDIWLRYARWLVAGLTLQLGADIIDSSVTQSWEAIGRLAAVAVIRTFLNYFLERDLSELRDREQQRATETSAAT
jgi:uncharacterized membrane protein